MIGGGQGDVRRGDADNWPVEVPEGLIGDNGYDFRAPAAKPWVLFHREQAAGLGDRAGPRLFWPT